MGSKQKSQTNTVRESEYRKMFKETRKKLDESGDIDLVIDVIVAEIPEGEEEQPTIIPFPYGGKGHTDWVSS